MLFGMIHAYLIWHGDILYPYALLGLFLFPLHSVRPKALLIAAGVCVVAMTGMQIGQGYHLQATHKLAMEAVQTAKDNKPLTDEQKSAQKEWEDTRKYFAPTPEDLKKEVDMYSGSYGNLAAKRAAVVKEWHSTPFYMSGWDMLTMMLVGIAFAKLGILDTSRSTQFYTRMLLAGYGFGLPVGSISAWLAYSQTLSRCRRFSLLAPTKLRG